MQLDCCATTYDLWTWNINVSDGMAINSGNASYAASAWATQVTNWQAYNQQHQPQVPMEPNFALGSNPCLFSYTPSGSQVPFSDGIWIKMYNYGHNYPNYFLVFANGDWTVNDGNNYVFNVCSTTP
jgi:hypothetical protein